MFASFELTAGGFTNQQGTPSWYLEDNESP